MKPLTTPRRLHGLDLLRGLAAWALLAWQWPLMVSTVLPGAELVDPLRWPEFLRPVQQHGEKIVLLLFCIAGYLSCRRHADAIARGRFEIGDALFNWWARVYFLYCAGTVVLFLTGALMPNGPGESGLGSVTAAQWVARALLIQAWTVDGSAHAAHPFDLLSIGWCVLLLFVAVARLRLGGPGPMIALFLAGGLFEPLNPTLSHAVTGFFGGALAARFEMRSAGWRARVRAAVTANVLGCAWAALTVLFAMPDTWIAREVLRPLASFRGGLGGTLIDWAALALLAPLLVLAMVRLEPHYAAAFRSLGVVGRLTPTASLVHAPLLSSLFLGLSIAGAQIDAANGLLFFGYALLLLYTSAAAFRFIEWPWARFMRGQYRAARTTVSRRSLPSAPMRRPRQPSPSGP